MSTSNRYSPEVRERAVRMVFEHQSEHASQWAAIKSIAEKIGCTVEALRVKAEADPSVLAGGAGEPAATEEAAPAAVDATEETSASDDTSSADASAPAEAPADAAPAEEASQEG